MCRRLHSFILILEERTYLSPLPHAASSCVLQSLIAGEENTQYWLRRMLVLLDARVKCVIRLGKFPGNSCTPRSSSQLHGI